MKGFIEIIFKNGERRLIISVAHYEERNNLLQIILLNGKTISLKLDDIKKYYEI